MHHTATSRRTVLKTITATAATGLVAGAASARPARPNPRNTVRFTTTHDHERDEHGFELSTATVAGGWVDVVLDNETEHAHFVYLAKLPQAAIDAAGDADLLAFYVEQVTNPFQGFMDLFAGETPRHPIVFPEWFPAVQAAGGVGLTSASTRAASTLYLPPGTYVAECYVKDGDNEFHSYNGMIELLRVEPGNGGREPTPTVTVGVSGDGISAPDRLRPGRHTVGVTFEDAAVYANLVGHDVHLVRIDGATTDDVSAWMDWRDPVVGLIDDATPGTFLGGVQEVAAGLLDESGRAYAHVVLPPGKYAWVAEVPTPLDSGFLRPLTVS